MTDLTYTQQTDTRARIIQAAADIMFQKGITRATTREIARRAGCSEGNLYNHFGSKEEIFLAILNEQLPAFVPLLAHLPEQVGCNTVSATLHEVAHAALRFFDQSVPMGAAFFADRTLLGRHRALLKERNAGPHKFNAAIAGYLQAEQENGRIGADVDTGTVADIIMGSCFMRAYWRQFIGEETSAKSDEEFVTTLLSSLALEF
ncbi:MAG: TetR/AcrR family transcriptional regulator [Caldilineaceae bacterium]